MKFTTGTNKNPVYAIFVPFMQDVLKYFMFVI